MGYDSGLLQDEITPEVPFKEEYKSWNKMLRDPWNMTQNPTTWMNTSCIWYSQVLTRQLGMKHFKSYVRVFEYGNVDLRGDENPGLTHAWLSSSLKISPLEQIAFLKKLLKDELPVSSHAHEMTKAILFKEDLTNGWKLYGKTGSGYQQSEDGTLNYDLQIGWFVGWIQRDDQILPFVTLIQDTKKEDGFGGPRAKEQAVKQLLSIDLN
jgi:beta-lactamase class D